MKNTILIIFTSFLIAFSVNAVEYPNNPNAKVDEKIIKNISFSGSSENEIIVYSVLSENFKKPFKWSVSVYKGKHELFHYEQNDKKIDEFFSDLGYVDNDCKNYIECKFTYYFENIPKHLTKRFFEPEFKHIRENVRNDLIERNKLKKNEVEEILRKMDKEAKSTGIPVLHLLTSSVMNGRYYVYLQKQKEFLEVSYGCC